MEVQAFGKTYTFGDKTNQLKDSVLLEGGGFETRFVFRNGESRVARFLPDHPLYAQFALHGADQKYGDFNAGIKDVEDIIGNWDELNERLQKGDWGASRDGTGLSGVSTLVKALVMVSGDSIEVVKGKLAATRKEENGHKAIAWLRSQPKIAAAISVIESEKAARAAEKGKGPALNTSAIAGAFNLGA
jgi:hypothetical protein